MSLKNQGVTGFMAASQPLIEKIRANDGYLWLRPVGSSRNQGLLAELIDVFEGCFSHQEYRIVLNLESVRLPSPSFIAMLFEMTGRARRAGGDVIILNLSASAKNNLLAFSPLTFLTIDNGGYYVPKNLTNDARTGPGPGDDVTASGNFATASSVLTQERVKPPVKNEPGPKVKVIDSIDTVTGKKSGDIQKFHLRIPSQIDMLYKACNFVTTYAEIANMPRAEISKVKIAVYEACLNVIEHAYRSKPNQWIEISVAFNAARFIILILDKGVPNNNELPDQEFDVEVAAKARKTGGMGMHIIRKSMDVVKYESDPVIGNKMIMIKFLQKHNDMAGIKK